MTSILNKAFWKNLWGGAPNMLPDACPTDQPVRLEILVVVEGVHDIQFLRRISVKLHAGEPRLPDLEQLERQGKLLFVPMGGDLPNWTNRLAGLGLPEFHLYDREMAPATEHRERAARLVNLRPHCRACLTAKRGLENYLHPEAIFEARGIELTFGAQDSVPDLAAKALYNRIPHEVGWEYLPSRTRKRLRDKAKRWLNAHAVDRMTMARLAERDPMAEVRGWLSAMDSLVRIGQTRFSRSRSPRNAS